MHLPHPFYKFPLRFDADRLRAEAEAFPEEAWQRHPQAFKGNTALPLITTNGTLNDNFDPPMRPTEFLQRSPYMQQVLATFKTLLGRARLMRLEPGDGVPMHFDKHYYWRHHTRVHIPIVTHPEVRFQCERTSVHMAAGEAWTFDNWRMHTVINERTTRRIHLTFDTYGSAAFWAMVRPLGQEEPPRLISYREGETPELCLNRILKNPRCRRPK
ncbi:MAG: aspartyl/asparaginyl beta-hydroxylase domain-containing protein [Alphaproteobacteria bacterium]